MDAVARALLGYVRPNPPAENLPTLQGRTYYHGVSVTKLGEAILRTGELRADPTLQLQKYRSTRARLAPQPGRVYLSASLRYAAIYALGGVWMGYEDDDLPDSYKAFKDGEYGYVFVIHGATIRGDVEPDEDSVGVLASAVLRGETSLDGDYQVLASTLLAQAAWTLPFRALVLRHATARQQRDLREGWVSQQAAVGKKLVKVMPPTMRAAMIEAGSFIAVQSPVRWTEAWRVHKGETASIEPDGSNLFTSFATERVA